jgi:hypothetical protein
MKPNVHLTIADLQQKWLDGLMISEEAVSRNADTYREMKKLLNIINSEPVDIGDYYRIASELGEMLHTLANDKREVIFRHFAERIDPRKNADVRSFRFECIDLSRQLSDLEQWRRNRRQLRIIRSAPQSSGGPLRCTV